MRGNNVIISSPIALSLHLGEGVEGNAFNAPVPITMGMIGNNKAGHDLRERMKKF